VFDEPLRFDILVDDCLLVELKAVEVLHPFSRAQLFSYMKLLNIPVGLLMNFHELVLKNGIFRMILPGANEAELRDENEPSFSWLSSVLDLFRGKSNRTKRRKRMFPGLGILLFHHV